MGPLETRSGFDTSVVVTRRKPVQRNRRVYLVCSIGGTHTNMAYRYLLVVFSFKMCPVSRITIPLVHKRPFPWFTRKSGLTWVSQGNPNTQINDMAEIPPKRRKIPINQSINQSSICIYIKWGKHVNYINEKASKRLFYLRQLKYAGLSESDLIKVYKSLIRPICEYACPNTWSFPKSARKQIQFKKTIKIWFTKMQDKSI
jgi:hypothetical protein